MILFTFRFSDRIAVTMTKKPEYEIRQMKFEEIPDAFELRRETNFLAEGLHSLYTWYEYDPGAFFVAVTKDGMLNSLFNFFWNPR